MALINRIAEKFEEVSLTFRKIQKLKCSQKVRNSCNFTADENLLSEFLSEDYTQWHCHWPISSINNAGPRRDNWTDVPTVL